MIIQALFLLLTYFICAIPFGLIVGKIFLKKDIRSEGSGNIGATNVARIGGKKLGAATLILDGFKGAIMIIIARFLFSDSHDLHSFLIITALVAILAHIYPVYLKFNGGKGVATAIACLLTLDITIGLLCIAIWIVSFLIFKISAISSIASIVSSIFSAIYLEAPRIELIFCFAISVIIIARHKDNIRRILAGNEHKV